jgi:ssDNA-binding Zn-finger/Zn-ribbon topoisomerase 1
MSESHEMIEETKCPICDGPMQSRANKNTGQRFWGCKAYPKCKGTRNTDGEAPRGEVSFTERESRLPSDRLRDNDRRRW